VIELHIAAAPREFDRIEFSGQCNFRVDRHV
jgi:hypothetical protein